MSARRNLELEVFKLAKLQTFKAEVFKGLSHPTRIRILELLREGEMSVSQLQAGLGDEGSTASQQLAILRMKNLVDTRREGTAIYYRLRDPQINDLLDAARRIFDAHVIQLQSMTEEDQAGIRAASGNQFRSQPRGRAAERIRLR
ncbi:MAG: ArsR/SmtB family transcription factor [Hyphomicrobiales bacterium]